MPLTPSEAHRLRSLFCFTIVLKPYIKETPLIPPALFSSPIAYSHSLPTLYEVDSEGEAAAIMEPVSSTVIPEEELPEFKVGGDN